MCPSRSRLVRVPAPSTTKISTCCCHPRDCGPCRPPSTNPWRTWRIGWRIFSALLSGARKISRRSSCSRRCRRVRSNLKLMWGRRTWSGRLLYRVCIIDDGAGCEVGRTIQWGSSQTRHHLPIQEGAGSREEGPGWGSAAAGRSEAVPEEREVGLD